MLESIRHWLFPFFALVFIAACAPMIGQSQANSPGDLVIYSGRSQDLVGPIIEQFSEATGVQVQVRYGSTAEMAATLMEEGQNSPADVFYAQDPGGLGAISSASLLATLPEETLGKVDPLFRSQDGLWVGVSGRARTVAYNTEALSPADLPGDIREFTDPVWDRRVGWAPTNASFQAMVTAMRQEWGDEATRNWIDDMQANHAVVFDNNTAIVAAVASGEVDVGFVNHYYLYRFLQEEGESFPARNYFLPDRGPGAMVLIAGVGILENGNNRNNAVRFINFMLSPVAQQYFASKTYEYPLVEGVQTPRDLPPLNDLLSTNVSLESLADLEGTLNLLRDEGVLP